ncbi:ATP-binding protein [Streptomyces sp. NPDC015492]|uniref:ATP-binding protein n=1 Tax=Streptomyces sp. NPDC015492 TaxID=3364958 RepID=UPI0036FDB808
MATGHRAGPLKPDTDRPALPRDASEARAQVAEALAGAAAATGGPPSATAVGDALLVTSELVTNALRHGGGLTGFRVEVDRDALVVTVADASRELPHVRRRRAQRVYGPGQGGFGWPLVRLLARGIRLTLPPGGGKIIEVRLPLH